MLNKKIILSALLMFFIFFSGVIRHDVDEESYLQLAQQKQFDCVGQVYIDTAMSGSCVLIRERFVLSAAHVFIEHETRMDTVEMGGRKVIVNTPINKKLVDVSQLFVQIKGEKLSVKKISLHPNYLDSLTQGSCDIALLELEQPLIEISSAPLSVSFDELESRVVGVGFGASGVADKPQTVKAFRKKIAGENVVDSLAGKDYLGLKTLLVCDFDHPTRTDCNKTGSPIPRPLEYSCSGGDSGGGLFKKNGERWELIGICGGNQINVPQLMKTGYYGQTMEWTRVSVFATWITEQMK